MREKSYKFKQYLLNKKLKLKKIVTVNIRILIEFDAFTREVHSRCDSQSTFISIK